MFSFFKQRHQRHQSESVRCFFENRKSEAEKGGAQAQFDLGCCYAKGEGVTKDAVAAVKWYRKAAEQNYYKAQRELGNCYAKGEGVERDGVEAEKWLEKAARQESNEGLKFIALSYLVSQNSQNYVEAVKLFRQVAEDDDADAQSLLGDCYRDGKGVTKNYVAAVKWYRKAAEQNHTEAQYNLSVCYAKGEGVEKDEVVAYKWYILASAKYKPIDSLKAFEAKRIHTINEQQMTPEQIAEAQKLAHEFKPRAAADFDKESTDSIPIANASGFFITEDGYLISNYQVLKDAAQLHLVTSAGLIYAKIVQVDPVNDLALLKAEGKFSSLPISQSRTAQLGSTVATIGFPDIGLQEFSPKLAKGEIASLSGARGDSRYFQISLPVQPGNSGGALVDEHGNVIGIVSATLDASVALAASGALPENVNYAVKSSLLLSFLESVPDVSAKFKEPITADRKFEDVVKSAQDAAVLVLVY